MQKIAICFYTALCLSLLFSCDEEKKKPRLTLDDCPVIATQTGDLTTLVGATGSYAVSENYIGLYTDNPRDYKLFNRKGEYIRSISSVGQGPDEYPITLLVRQSATIASYEVNAIWK